MNNEEFRRVLDVYNLEEAVMGTVDADDALIVEGSEYGVTRQSVAFANREVYMA